MKPSNTIIVSSEQIVRLNAIIHNQREKLKTLEEDKKILKKEKVELLKKIDELEKNLAGAEQAVQEGLEINEELKAENEKLKKKLAIAMEALDAVSGDYNEAENLGYYFKRIEEVK